MNESNRMENISPELLGIMIRQLQKVASQPEEMQLKAWLAEDPQNRARFEEVAGIWKLTDPSLDSFQPDTASAWEKVKQRTTHESDAFASKPTSGKRVFFPHLFMSSAASLLLLVGFGFLLRSAFQSDPEWTSVSTGREQQWVVLPDSSKVWLNRQSTLSWSDFQEDTREVRLSGEAFFEVRRRPEQPFRISTPNSLTEVLGTSFNLRSISGKPDEIEVVTGKVAFSSLTKSSQRVELLPGQKCLLRPDEIPAAVSAKDPNFRAWQTRKLAFSNARLDEVSQALERYYGIRVEIRNEAVRRCRFTGTFDNPELDEILQVLSVSVGLQTTVQDSVYLFSGNGCP